MVGPAADYPWSSFPYRMQSSSSSYLLDVHPCYEYLDPTERSRQEKYEQFVNAGIPDNELRLVREAVHRCQLTGGGVLSMK